MWDPNIWLFTELFKCQYVRNTTSSTASLLCRLCYDQRHWKSIGYYSTLINILQLLIPSCFTAHHSRERSYILSRFPKETCFSLLTSQYHEQMDQSCKNPHIQFPSFLPFMCSHRCIHGQQGLSLFSFRLCCSDKGKPPVPHWRWCLTQITIASSIPHPPTDFLCDLTCVF